VSLEGYDVGPWSRPGQAPPRPRDDGESPGVYRPGTAPSREFESVLNRELRVPRDLPQVTVRILKVPRVTSPERRARWFHDAGPR
jgi:hypothetical protein